MNLLKPLVVLALLALTACAPQGVEDPLKNTRKLTSEGHRSLYKNGAFPIPFTELKLIPAGPKVEDILFEQAGMNAREAFFANIAEAWQATEIVTNGTRHSYRLSRNISRETGQIVTAIVGHSRPGSRLIAYKAYLKDKGIRGEAWRISDEAQAALEKAGSGLAQAAARSGGGTADAGADWVVGSPALANAIVSKAHGMSLGVELAMDADAARMGRRLHASGDSLLISGSARTFTLAATTAASYRSAVKSGEGMRADVADSGSKLRDKSRASGDKMTSAGLGLAAGSLGLAASRYGEAAQAAEQVEGILDKTAERISNDTAKTGDELSEGGTRRGSEMIGSSISLAGKVGSERLGAAGENFSSAGNYLIGYGAVPKKIVGRYAAVPMTELGKESAAEWNKTNALRTEQSGAVTEMMVDTYDHYGDRVMLKLHKAGETWDNNWEKVGVFAAFKAARWVVEGILWDGVLKPAGKMVGGAVGLIAVNGVVWPTLMAYDGVQTTAQGVVEVTKATALSGYDLVAPSAGAGLTAIMGIANTVAGVGAAAGIATGGTVVGAVDAAVSNTAGFTLKYGGKVAGGAVQYVGVPLAYAGIHTAGAVVGVMAGTGALAAGAVQAGAGQTVKGAGMLTGAVMEYGLAPATKGVMVAGGTIGGVGKGLYDEFTGATLYATGGVVKGAAWALENSIKYGVSPVARVGVATTGVGVGLAGGAAQATAGSVVYLWGNAVYGTGYVAGKAIEHGAAPVTRTGIVFTGGVTGGAVQVGGDVVASATALAGEAAGGVTWIFGNTIAAATLAGGTAGSAVAGTAVGLYEIASSITVPVGHLLGGGIVLSYKSITHLAAHSVLAVTDASYLVLSLEGPRWVIYAIKGNRGDGRNLRGGEILDLKKMQAEGEVIYNVPVSQEELTRVVNSVVEDLPQAKEQ